MQNILVPIDFSAITSKIIDQAKIQALAHHSQVWLIHVAAPDPEFVGYETGPKTVRHHVAERFRQEHRQIQELATQLRQEGIEAIALLVQGATVATILTEAEKLNTDLIIIGSHGRTGIIKTLLGSVSEELMRHAPCPILIVPNQD